MTRHKGQLVSAQKQEPLILPPSTRPVPPMVIWLFCAYLLLLPCADWLLRLFLDMTRDRSRFAVINALTLTGIQSTIGTSTYPPAAKWLVLVLTIFGSVFAMIIGGMAVVRIVRLPYTDGQVARASILAVLLACVVGAIPLIAANEPPVSAFMLSASAFGNSGLYVGNLPGLRSWETQLILLPLAILGGLGLPVLMELRDVLRGRKLLSAYARTILLLTAGMYLAVFIACLLVQYWTSETSPRSADVLRMASTSSVAAINSRTLGFPFQYAQEYPRAMHWVLMLSMIIGGSPGGTAGGLKTTTILELFGGVRRALRGKPVGRCFGIAATWLAIYVGLVLICLILLLSSVPQVSADRLLFETISASSNVGLSHEVVLIVKPGLDVLSAAMLLGRMAPLWILWWMARSGEPADLPVG